MDNRDTEETKVIAGIEEERREKCNGCVCTCIRAWIQETTDTNNIYIYTCT